MTLPRVILRLSALVFGCFGFASAVLPHRMASYVDLSLPTDLARTDFAATYGGAQLGIAVFLWLCSRRDAWLRPGLIASGYVIGGFATIRMIGILTSTVRDPLMLQVVIVEAVASAISFWAASRTS